MTIPCRPILHAVGCTLFAFTLIASGCALSPYQEQADMIKERVDNFYVHLKSNRVAAAVHENQQIEAMADEMGETVRMRAKMYGTSQAGREFALMKTARETAAQNWLALGQYFAIKQQPDKARATYQRVIDTYTSPTERGYREQAARALKDLGLVSPASNSMSP